MVVDILRAASRESVSLTSLVYRSNSNFVRTRRYVGLLVARGLLEKSGNPLEVYVITQKGEEALRTLTGVDELVFGREASGWTPYGLHDAGAFGPSAGGVRDPVSVSFATLRGACKHRRGDRCDAGQGECKVENCLLVAG